MPNQNTLLLDALTREGVLINVSIRFWRGCKKLKPEDIGLNVENLSDRLISLGHKRLLPKDALAELNLIEGRAHAMIDENTFPFLHGLGHFVPNGRLEEVTTKLKTLETEFCQAKERFLEKYATLRASAAVEWRAMATKLVPDPERVVSIIEDSFPLQNQMSRFFGFDLQLFQISLPENLSMDLITLEDQQQVIAARQRAAQEAGKKIKHEVESFVADCVAALREQTAQLCEDMLHSINTSQTGVHQKTLNRLVNFIDQFKKMNFASDTVMERQLEQVKKELLTRTAEQYRDNDYAKGQLVKGLNNLSNVARNLAKQDATELVQRFGRLGQRKFSLAA